MRCGCVQGLTSRHKRLGAALRAVLGRPDWGSATPIRSARVARVPCPFATMLTDWNHCRPGHNLIQKME